MLDKVSNIQNGHTIAILGERLQVEVNRVSEIEIRHTCFYHKVVNLLIVQIALHSHIGN
jgi:hypothetical protein